jgi:Na+-translocating ferredoxin:NAD+ oxidoreductase subunit B
VTAPYPALSVLDAVAVIDEQRCIGCTLCLEACPVDAIVGAAKLMHTVLASSCTGCELCVPACPVDCILVRAIAPRNAVALDIATADACRRAQVRQARLARIREEQADKAAARREDSAARKKRETIAKAMERARTRLAATRK